MTYHWRPLDARRFHVAHLSEKPPEVIEVCFGASAAKLPLIRAVSIQLTTSTCAEAYVVTGPPGCLVLYRILFRKQPQGNVVCYGVQQIQPDTMLALTFEDTPGNALDIARTKAEECLGVYSPAIPHLSR